MFFLLTVFAVFPALEDFPASISWPVMALALIRLAIIPKPLTDHVCQPGPIHGLAMRTAAWARTQLRA